MGTTGSSSEDPPPLDPALEASAEELYEDAPCGYLSTLPDGRIVKVNRTFLDWTGYAREELLGGRRLVDLLTAGGRIYHETHYAPLLALQGSASEIAMEVRRADGTRLPVLLTSLVKRGADRQPLLIRTTVFSAVDRRAYEHELLLARDRERDVAHVLQRSLLASEPLRDPRIGIGAHYRPAVDTLEVGGDWHDAFPAGEGRVGVVVGDVVGRGIEAASAMGQLRSATRALAGADLGGPAQLLERLDRFASGVPLALMATLAYAEIELDGGAVRYACAGHPPPLLLAPGAEPVVLWEGRSLPLGVATEAARPADGRVTLVPGGRLLLYTDGLVERHDEPLDRGLERLAAAVEALRSCAPQALVDELVETLRQDDTPRDDICALCVELSSHGAA